MGSKAALARITGCTGLVVATWLAGCAGPTYVTSHGLRVFDNTGLRIPRMGVEAVTESALAFFDEPIALDGVEIHFYSKLIAIPGPDDTVIIADGYTDSSGRKVLVSSFSTCVAASSLAHELGHVVREARGQTPDPGHRDVAFWSEVEALDAQLQTRMCTPRDRKTEALARRSPSDVRDADRQATEARSTGSERTGGGSARPPR